MLRFTQEHACLRIRTKPVDMREDRLQTPQGENSSQTVATIVEGSRLGPYFAQWIRITRASDPPGSFAICSFPSVLFLRYKFEAPREGTISYAAPIELPKTLSGRCRITRASMVAQTRR